MFEQALAIDPNNAAALASDAAAYFREHLFRWGNPGTDYDAKILGQADRAIALAPGYDQPYMFKSLYLGDSRRFDEAVGAADAGLAVNPNNPNLYLARAGPEIALGRSDEAKSDLQQGIRLSPRDPFVGFFRTELLVEGASTKWPKNEVDDYAERTAKTVSAWSGMNGLQGGDPAKLAAAMVQLSDSGDLPLRFVAGADAMAAVEANLKTIQAQIDANRTLSASLVIDE